MDARSMVDQAKRGDPRAREWIVLQIEPRITSLANHYAWNTRKDKEDLLQDIWVVIFSALDDVDVSIGDPLAYLIQRAKWFILEERRRVWRKNIISEVPLEYVLQYETSLQLSRRSRNHGWSSLNYRIRSRSGLFDQIWGKQMIGQLRLALAKRPVQLEVLDGLISGEFPAELARERDCSEQNISYLISQIRRKYGEIFPAD